MRIGKICRKIVVLSLALSSLTGCAELMDGPFNQGRGAVPSLLYANNGSDYVTYWDEESGSYRTYDQRENRFLAEVVFETESEEASQNYMIAGLSVVPLTRLNDEEMLMQSEQGCVACHER